MRVLLQRVQKAHVEVDGQTTGSIARGLLLLVGIENADTAQDIEWMVGKIARLRIFPDENGIMNRSLENCGGEILAVSQFTLFGDCARGNRPSWSRAAKGERSQPMFESFVKKLESTLGQPVPTGIFGADMQVHLVNDGPVTLMLDSRER